MLSYDYWVEPLQSRSASRRQEDSRQRLPDDHRRRVGAPALPASIRRESPQIRVPILMKPVMVPEWTWVHMDDRRTRWVQVFARLKPGYTVESAQAPLQGLFTQIREYEMTLPAAKDWSAYDARAVHEGQLHVEPAAMGYSGCATISRRRSSC